MLPGRDANGIRGEEEFLAWPDAVLVGEPSSGRVWEWPPMVELPDLWPAQRVTEVALGDSPECVVGLAGLFGLDDVALEDWVFLGQTPLVPLLGGPDVDRGGSVEVRCEGDQRVGDDVVWERPSDGDA